MSREPSPLMVAVVDDNPRIRQLIEDEIHDEGHNVKGFSSGEAFLNAARQESIDLVLMDLMMPGMDGLECLKRLQHQSQHGATPRVVIVTALNDSGKRQAAFQAGAENYVLKPDLFEQLPSLLTRSDQH